ncbi:DUF2461 domain-containing protein, partial [Thermodesulfobacteriota bacterium]
MTAKAKFSGFPKECIEFFNALKDNNNKEWFAKNKKNFDKAVMGTARDFVQHMGERLRELSPKIMADPRIDKSIFRIYRDVRFSKDKSPYKTHMGILFWEGDDPKMECPGFYFHLEPPDIMFGAGMHCFSRQMLQIYRDAVVDPKLGKSLVKAINEVKKNGDYEIGVKHYKRTPRGYDSDHENAELLLYNGLTAWRMEKIPKELNS